MATIGYILLAVAVLPYIAVPILIWRTQRFTASFHLRVLQESFLPKEVISEFQKLGEPLTERGFEPCFDAVSTDEFLGLRFYHRILMSRLQKTWAICTAICDPEGTFQKSYLELKTEFQGTGSVSTHNSDLIGAPIKSRTQRAMALPAQTLPTVVLNVHLRNLGKLRGDIVEPSAENASATFKRFLMQYHDEQVDLGAIYFDEAEKIYRPTWAGAFLIGWYSMWPLTFIRRFFSALRIRSLSKEVLNG
jgi:hypothetical protein